ncbi:MAG TPA: hypothetical protein VHZ26_04585 [Caulobacteraceae bacterium]|jgi:hypothetical protein|nr:hypothetical protein [Caulobacteraceae bacterium]
MRIVALIGLGALLAGCNMVTSTSPLFSSADVRGQPQPRPGVWMDEDNTCIFDTAKPIGQWPGCADAWVVHPGAILAGRDPGTPISAWTSYKTTLAKGDPAVLQIEVGADNPPKGYIYVGLRTLKSDSHGRVIEYKAWPALCGPPAPPDPTGQQPPAVTQQPIAGLVIDKDHHDCTASAKGPVLAAVKASEAWGGDADGRGRDHARWVRDGDQ